MRRRLTVLAVTVAPLVLVSAVVVVATEAVQLVERADRMSALGDAAAAKSAAVWGALTGRDPGPLSGAAPSETDARDA